MARARRTSFPRRSGAGRRRVTWSRGPDGVLSPASSAISVFPTGSQALEDDLTVVRLRGELLLYLLTAAAAQQGFRVGFGICNITENAAGVGATAVPGPLADIAWDGWFVHWIGAVKSVDATPAADGAVGVGVRVVIDSKAMRKTHRTDVVTAVLEVEEVGTATMHAEFNSRLLDKLP